MEIHELKSTMGKARWLYNCLQESRDLGFLVPKYEEINPDFLKEASDFFSFRIDWIVKSESKKLLTYYDLLFEKYKWKTIMIRSNSMAEDWRHSFTWVYQSIKIKCDTIENFLSWIKNVYYSYNTEKAIKYRKKYSIQDTMWILIQEYVEWIENWYWTIHSCCPQGKKYMPIAWWNHMQEEHCGNALGFKSDDEITPVIQYDSGLPYNQEKYIEKLLSIVQKLEKKYGRIAIEYVIWKDGSIHVVQMRSLNYPDNEKLQENSDILCLLDKWCPAFFTDLPVLVVNSIEEEFLKAHHDPCWNKIYDIPNRIKMANSFSKVFPQFKYKLMNNWFDIISKFNKDNPNWYVLLIPNWLPKSWFDMSAELENDLFSNTKAIITKKYESFYSNSILHKWVLAREEDIPAINYERNKNNSRDLSRNKNVIDIDEIKTWDRLSIRENDWGESFLVRDNQVWVSIERLKCLYPDMKIVENNSGKYEIEFQWTWINLEPFYNFLGLIPKMCAIFA